MIFFLTKPQKTQSNTNAKLTTNNSKEKDYNLYKLTNRITRGNL
jgi:hypothetical protein